MEKLGRLVGRGYCRPRNAEALPPLRLAPAASSTVRGQRAAAAARVLSSAPAASSSAAVAAACGTLAVQAHRRGGRHWRLRGCKVRASTATANFVRGGSSSSSARSTTDATVRPAQATDAPSTSDTAVRWTVDDVRQAFIDFYKDKKDHKFVASSPVVPLSDPTLLFANAGMNQFKAIFMGQLEPNSPLQGVTRAVNSQKCIRAGGKHNDLDDVGRDVYHHTFFEMLGNWSFGDYFKEEAIDWAWELLTEVYGLSPERLYASYFGGDESLGLPADLEARDFWLKHLPASRILPFGKGDNFWEMGAVGPCGPCSELHYDRIGGRDAAALVNADDPDVLEIWNLVFMQFYRDESGSLTTLPSQHIDTGMGLERVVSVLQDKRSNYDTDVFAPLLAALHEQVGGDTYQGRVGPEDPSLRDTAYRVIVDHARTLTLAVADGALPSSEGRGYVLRRILRRAVRYGRQKLDAPSGFFSKLVPKVVECLSPGYPDLSDAVCERVQAVLQEEEVAFDRTVDRGMQYFEGLKAELAKDGRSAVPGDQAFLLYDSLGFPIDLTQQMAEEAGLSVDMAGFEDAMEQQKERSREAQREQQALEQGVRPLQLVAEQTAWLDSQGIAFTVDEQKYEWDVRPAGCIKAIFSDAGFVQSTDEIQQSNSGTSIGLVLDNTSFYAEAGGQVGDVGSFSSEDGQQLLDVKVTQVFGGYVLHTGLKPAAALRVGDKVYCEVDYEHRRQVACNHTMTHALNWALRDVLGEGIDQRGSLVTAEKLRFDFSYEASSGVSVQDLQKVESRVQDLISAAVPVTWQTASLSQAQSITGLRAVAGEAYPDPVRVVTVGASSVDSMLASPAEPNWQEQSVEFCGGTHISCSSEAGSFVLLEERGISKGVRRIVAVTSAAAKTAQEDGSRLQQTLESLEAQSTVDEQALLELGKNLDTYDFSAPLKADCRDRLGKLRKQLKKQQNKQKKKGGKASAEEVAAAKATLVDAVAAAQEAKLKYCVLTIQGPGMDGKTLRNVISDSSLGDIAILVISKLEGGAAEVLASVPDSLAKGAGDWVSSTLGPLGGKGGGNASFAQGSAKAADAEAVAKAEEAAKDFFAVPA